MVPAFAQIKRDTTKHCGDTEGDTIFPVTITHFEVKSTTTKNWNGTDYTEVEVEVSYITNNVMEAYVKYAFINLRTGRYMSAFIDLGSRLPLIDNQLITTVRRLAWAGDTAVIIKVYAEFIDWNGDITTSNVDHAVHVTSNTKVLWLYDLNGRKIELGPGGRIPTLSRGLYFKYYGLGISKKFVVL